MLLRFRLDKTARAGTLVTQRYCNIACVWCHHDYFEHNGFAAIDNDRFYAAVNRVIRAASADEAFVRLGGDGEPTTVGSEELVDIITRLRSIPQVTKVSLTTNGILLGGMAELLQSAGLSSITVSLNSLSRSGYIRYAQYDGLGTVMSSINKAIEANIRLKINVIYCKWNQHEVDDFEDLSREYGGMPIKVFDLLVQNDRDRELYLPLSQLEDKLCKKASFITEKSCPYAQRIYQLHSGAIFVVKIAGSVNTCPNLACNFRHSCLEGCRHSIRIGLDGVMRPCGVRTDNAIDLFDSNTTDDDIRAALRNGGKI